MNRRKGQGQELAAGLRRYPCIGTVATYPSPEPRLRPIGPFGDWHALISLQRVSRHTPPSLKLRYAFGQPDVWWDD